MTEYSAVHQFHSGTAMGDAITGQMFRLQNLLRGMGFGSEIFAEHIASGLQDRIRSIHSYEPLSSDLLLLHHSIGYDAFDDLIGLPVNIVAIYHNVTPEEYFEDESVRRYIRLGREQLTLLGRRALFGVAVSNFNRREMLAVGFRRVEVLPVRVDFSSFAGPDRQGQLASADWLYVGRIIGNKCQHDLVEAFAVYHHTFNHDARLVLAGDTSATEFVARVHKTAERLGVYDRLVVLGKVSETKLPSVFAGAGVFVSVSEHEGFGVPILEAMAAGLPVVAFGAAAIPETMGGAGILLRRKDPELVAATVHTVQTDGELRHRLIQRQFERVQQVATFDTQRLLQRVIDRAGGRQVPLEIQIQGPFETSYSLAAVNRSLALGLDRSAEISASIYATEGPGDYEPAREDLDKYPEATALYKRRTKVPFPDVVIRQMYPPRVIDTPGGITCEYFGWEESRIPEAMVQDFNRYLDGVGVMSEFVRTVLRDSGVDIPIRVVGMGVEPPDPGAVADLPELHDLRSFTFLNIGSAFPRKGIDVLLGAFYAAFDGDSDVTLVLKSFPNPHNVVGAILASLNARHKNPPDVRWIDRDLDDSQMQGLYNVADCYVHPARGEGFGLPVAEAMAAGVPVISVAYSGLADFVSDETAVTIPFKLGPAQTHFDLADSEWAVPDLAQLTIELQKVAEHSEEPEIGQRVARAQQVVRSRHSWDAAVSRWEEFVFDLEESIGRLQVAMVSTWNTRCGIAENTRYIIDHSHDRIDFELFADAEVEPLDPLAEHGVVRTWRNRWQPDLTQLEEALRLTEAPVLHVQFNFGFFEFNHMAELIERQLAVRGVVVTMHRTQDYWDQGELLSLREITSTLAKVDQIIVHQESDARYLAELGLVDNVTVVPVGASGPLNISPAEARRALRIGERPIVGTFGFLLPHKGTLELLWAIDALRKEFPDVLLLALCARYPDIVSEDYEIQLRREIASRHLEKNVILVTDYLDEEVARRMLVTSDVIVLPYRETGESSSAALRFVLPLGRALVVTDEPIFDDSRDAMLVIDPSDPNAIEEAVGRVLTDQRLQADLASRAAQRARRFRWERVVADHRDIYLAAIRAGRRRAQSAPADDWRRLAEAVTVGKGA